MAGKIALVSHGLPTTGGTQHLRGLADALQGHFPKVKIRHTHLPRVVSGLKEHLVLQNEAYTYYKKTDVRLVPLRFALWALWAKRRHSGRVGVVLHNAAEHTGPWLRRYTGLVMGLLRRRHGTFVISSSRAWQSHFDKSGVQAAYFPDLFPVMELGAYRLTPKTNSVYLGPWGAKAHPGLPALAQQLKNEGFAPYFTDMNMPEGAHPVLREGVSVFSGARQDYLTRMAESQATILWSKYPEGRPRMGMESLIVGTQLIGIHQPLEGFGDENSITGVPELVAIGGGVMLKGQLAANEVAGLLKQGLAPAPPLDALMDFDEAQGERWLREGGILDYLSI